MASAMAETACGTAGDGGISSVPEDGQSEEGQRPLKTGLLPLRLEALSLMTDFGSSGYGCAGAKIEGVSGDKTQTDPFAPRAEDGGREASQRDCARLEWLRALSGA